MTSLLFWAREAHQFADLEPGATPGAGQIADIGEVVLTAFEELDEWQVLGE